MKFEAAMNRYLIGNEVCFDNKLTLKGGLLPQRSESLHGRHSQVPVGRLGQLHCDAAVASCVLFVLVFSEAVT